MSSQPLSRRSRVNSSSGNEPASPAAGASTVPRATSMVSSSEGRPHRVEQGPAQLRLDLDGSSPCFVQLLRKMSREARRHDRLEPVVEKRPHGVLPRRAGAEVRARPRGWWRRRTRAGSGRSRGRRATPQNRPAPNPVRSTRLSQSDGMIWSVSTSERSRGTARPVTTRDGLPLRAPGVASPGGGEVAGDGGGGRHGGGHEVGAPAPALASLEVPVRGRRAALAHGELVGVHGQAHRAARLAPLEAGGDEDLVEPLGLGLGLHAVRPGHDEGPHARCGRGGRRAPPRRPGGPRCASWCTTR